MLGVMQKEVETTLRAVLHKDNRQERLKIKISNFLIDCEMKPWPAVRKIAFEENGREVPAFPEMIVLTVQPKPGRRSSAAYQPITHLQVEKDHSSGKTPEMADDRRKSDACNARKSNNTPSVPNTVKNLRSSTPKENLITRTVPLVSGSDSTAGPSESGKNSKEGCDVFHGDLRNAKQMNRKQQSLVSEASVTSSQSSDDNERECSSWSISNKKSETRRKNIKTHNSNDVRKRQSKADAVHEENTKECEAHEDNPIDVEPDPEENTKLLRSKRVKNVENSILERTKSDTTGTEIVCNEKCPQSPNLDGYSRSASEIRKRKASRRNIRNTGYSLRKNTNTEACGDFSENESEKSRPHKQQAQQSSNGPSSPSQNSSHLSSKPHTRLKRTGVGNVATKASSVPSESPKSQTSDRSTSPRRSKRLKAVSQKDLPPAKRARAADNNENVNNNNSNYCHLTSTGTQTQGSTYRIKNADLKFLKKLAIPENAVASHSGRRRRRVLPTYPSTNEEIGTRCTNQEALCYKRDRTLIQQEELAEEMKLQQMALASSQHKCSKRVAGKGKNKRRSFMSRLGDMITPVKKLFK